MRSIFTLILFCHTSFCSVAQNNRWAKSNGNADTLYELLKPGTDWNATARQRQLDAMMLSAQSQQSRNNLIVTFSALFSKYGCENSIKVIEASIPLLQSLTSSDMPGTDWLKSAKIYSTNNINFVVAEMVSDNTGPTTKKYIFSYVPAINWNAFVDPTVAAGRLTHGERFNDFIVDYKCNCQ